MIRPKDVTGVLLGKVSNLVPEDPFHVGTGMIFANMDKSEISTKKGPELLIHLGRTMLETQIDWRNREMGFVADSLDNPEFILGLVTQALTISETQQMKTTEAIA